MDLAAGRRGRIPSRSSGQVLLAIYRKPAATWLRRVPTLTATTFILVFHEDPPPQFADWSVNFRFGKPVTAGGAETEAPPASRAASTAGQQPAAATAEQENLFWQSIVDSIEPRLCSRRIWSSSPNGVFRALAQARLAEVARAGRGCAAACRGIEGVRRDEVRDGSRRGSSGWARRARKRIATGAAGDAGPDQPGVLIWASTR